MKNWIKAVFFTIGLFVGIPLFLCSTYFVLKCIATLMVNYQLIFEYAIGGIAFFTLFSFLVIMRKQYLDDPEYFKRMETFTINEDEYWR